MSTLLLHFVSRHALLPSVRSTQAVNGLTLNVRKMFLDMDAGLYEECQRQFLDDEARAAESDAQREHTWSRLEAAGAAGGIGGGAMGEGGAVEGSNGVKAEGERPEAPSAGAGGAGGSEGAGQ